MIVFSDPEMTAYSKAKMYANLFHHSQKNHSIQTRNTPPIVSLPLKKAKKTIPNKKRTKCYFCFKN
jgi:hypothetical protein